MSDPVKKFFRLPKSQMVVERKSADDELVGYEESGPNWSMPIFSHTETDPATGMSVTSQYVIPRPRAEGVAANNPLTVAPGFRQAAGIWTVEELIKKYGDDPDLMPILTGASPGAVSIGGKEKDLLPVDPNFKAGKEGTTGQYVRAGAGSVAAGLMGLVVPPARGFRGLARNTALDALVGGGTRYVTGLLTGEPEKDARGSALIEGGAWGLSGLIPNTVEAAKNAARFATEKDMKESVELIKKLTGQDISKREMLRDMANIGVNLTRGEITGSKGWLEAQEFATGGFMTMLSGAHRRTKQSMKNIKDYADYLIGLFGPRQSPAEFQSTMREYFDGVLKQGNEHFERLYDSLKYAYDFVVNHSPKQAKALLTLQTMLERRKTAETQVTIGRLIDAVENVKRLEGGSGIGTFRDTLAKYRFYLDQADAAEKGSIEHQTYDALQEVLRADLNASALRKGNATLNKTKTILDALADERLAFNKSVKDAKLSAMATGHIDNISSELLNMEEGQAAALIDLIKNWANTKTDKDRGQRILRQIQGHVVSRMFGKTELVTGSKAARAEQVLVSSAGPAEYIESRIPIIKRLFEATPEGEAAIGTIGALASVTRMAKNRLNPAIEHIPRRRLHWLGLNGLEIAGVLITGGLTGLLGTRGALLGASGAGAEYILARMIFSPKASRQLLEGLHQQRYFPARGAAWMMKSIASLANSDSQVRAAIEQDNGQGTLDIIDQINKESIADTEKRVQAQIPPEQPEVRYVPVYQEQEQ